MDERSRRALAAAVDVAREQGLRVTEPTVLRDRANLLVRLGPAAVVARIATQTATVRSGTAWLAREVAIAGFLAAAGAPVVAPADELSPGPYLRDGFALSFWRWERESTPVDAVAAGRALRDCHRLLEAYDAPLPRFGAFDEVDRLLDDLVEQVPAAELADARRDWRRLRTEVDDLDLPLRPVHGDAHLGNVLQTARGPLWNDWEDCFAGPALWDVACLQAFPRPGGRAPDVLAAAVDAYRPDLDDAHALDVLTAARRLQGAVWGAVFARARRQPVELRRSGWAAGVSGSA